MWNSEGRAASREGKCGNAEAAVGEGTREKQEAPRHKEAGAQPISYKAFKRKDPRERVTTAPNRQAGPALRIRLIHKG